MARVPSVLRELWWFKSTIIMIATPLLLLLIFPFREQMGLQQKEANCLYMLLLMAVYWCTETVHLAVTSLIPLVLAPLMSIQEIDKVSRAYFKELNVMFMGGLIVAVVIEHSQLHRRIALTILRKVGTNPRLLMLGFMIPTWFLSMWISNTATTAMMIAIVQAVISQLKQDDMDSLEMQEKIGDGATNEGYEKDVEALNDDERLDQNHLGMKEKETIEDEGDINRMKLNKKWAEQAKALSLCVCYAATSGGIATLTGTTPNLILSENVKIVGKELNYDFGVDFATWMGYGLPISFVMMFFAWIWLQIHFIGCRGQGQTEEEKDQIKRVIDREYAKLGGIKWKEVVALVNFVLLAVLWITKNPGGVGGWGSLFIKGYVTDATPAMLIAILCFMYPSEKPDFFCWRGGCGKRDGEHKPGPREPLITWGVVAHKLPWGLILLLGGGFALADSISVSGLSDTIGRGLNFFGGWPIWAIIMCLSLITASITEVTSNTAITTIFLPIVAGLAKENQINPLYLMLPVCASASFAFMLPVATPPNALVFATGALRITDMAKAGFFLNIFGVCLTTLATTTYGAALFDLSNFSYNTTSFSNTTDLANSTLFL